MSDTQSTKVPASAAMPGSVSNTPLSDASAALVMIGTGYSGFVDLEIARQLERELAEAKAMLDSLNNQPQTKP